jgi:hypothetical protein
LIPWCGWWGPQEIYGEIKVYVLPVKDRCDWIMKEKITGSDWRGQRIGRLVGALGLLLALVLVAGAFMPAYAQDDDMPPAIPHFFAGTVSTSAGASVPGGTWVEAWMEGVKKADTPVTNTSTYAFFVPSGYSDQGKIVSFTVGGVQASQTIAWQAGGQNLTFDLTIAALPDGDPFPFPLPCFIATAAYGTDNAEEINLLRRFRDVVLLPSGAGAELVALYYEISPPIAEVVWRNDFLRTAVRAGFIDPIVAILNWSHALWSETD